MVAKSKRILVAGGAGYIGSHFCHLANLKGFQPIVLDRIESTSSKVMNYRRSISDHFALIEGNISDVKLVSDICDNFKPVAAVCFAADIEVGESEKNPDKYWQNNFYNATKFLSTLNLNGINKVIFSSTAATYGNPKQDEQLLESSLLSPINVYGKTKLATEIFLQGIKPNISQSFLNENASHLAHLKSLPKHNIISGIFRYFNAAGALPSLKLGEVHEPETHLIPNAINYALNKHEHKFSIFGNDYPTRDGTCIRDYLHVKDIALAHIAGLEHLLTRKSNFLANLGTGHGNSINEVWQAISKHTKSKKVPEYSERRVGDPNQLIANASEAKKLFNWTPKEDLDSIILDAIAFHKDYD